MALIWPLVLSAQTLYPPPDPSGGWAEIQQGLASGSPLQVAIAASRITAVSHPDRGQWLRAALAGSTSLQPEADARRARQVILDAMIRTRTPARLSELLPFFDESPDAVIDVIAKAMPRQSEDLSPLLRKAEEQRSIIYWNAIASLMDRGTLVRALLQIVRFDYTVSFLDSDLVPVQIWEPRGVTGGGLGSMLGGVIGGLPGQKKIWPDVMDYRIEGSGEPRDRLTCCIGGPTYLKTTLLSAPDITYRPRSPILEPWEEHNSAIIAILLDMAYCRFCATFQPDLPDIRGGKATVVWHSAEQAGTLLRQAVDNYLQQCVRMVASLRDVSLTEAEIRSKVRIWLRDRRRVQTVPLPALAAGVEVQYCAPFHKSPDNPHCLN